MIINKYIKPISLSLALLMATPTISSATNLGDIVMSTSTSAGSWTDPLGGNTYHSAGSFKLKLKTTSQAGPWFQFRQPKMSIGCSGIDLDAGFLAYLGLDKLQDAFSDAGSSLMFGIIMGIEFTMPTIAAVFNKIRAWANALQAMLQNSCNIGQAIAKSGDLAGVFHAKEMSSAIEEPFDKMNDWMKGGEELLEDIKELGDCDGSTELGACGEKLKNAVTALGSLVQDNDKEGKSSDNISKDSVLPGTTGKEITKAFMLSDFYSSKKIDGCTNATTIALSDEDILVDQLKYIFFGDIGNNDYAVQAIAEKLDNTLCIIKPGALASDLAASITSGLPSKFPSPKFSIITPLINSEDAAEILVNGFGVVTDKYDAVNGNIITIPDRQMLYLDLPLGVTEDGANSTNRIRVTYTSNHSVLSGGTTIEWNGALKDSLKGIENLVDAQTGQTWRLGTSYDEYDTSSVGSINTPLLLPSVKKYISVITRLEKKAQGETAETKSLKVVLAKINAIKYSRALIEGIESRVLALHGRKSGNSAIINAYITSIRKVKKDTNEILIKMQDEIFTKDLTKIFKDLELDMQLDSMKAIR